MWSKDDDLKAWAKVESFESVVQKLEEMASKKKQDEKNLKLLRELVSTSSNKYCFDCQQRGPTYVNMTIGSFVCTTCSGLLRGLTPPHRVKSISMASFTDEEILLLKSRGNEFCRRVWLGLYDPSQITDVSDESHVKDFMINKYERKRFYLDPSKITMPLSQQQPKPHTPPTQRQLPANSLALPRTTANNNNNGHRQTDPFSPVTATPPPLVAAQQDNFANFDNNPIFNAAAVNSTPTKQQQQNVQPMSTTSTPIMSNNSSPGQDRYAALKDLDSLMKASTTPTQWGTNGTAQSVFDTPPSHQQHSNSSNTSSLFLTPDTSVQSASPGNPFVVNQSSNNNPWGNATPPSFSQPSANSFRHTNPFDAPTNGTFGNHQTATAAAAATVDSGWTANFQDASFGSPMSQNSSSGFGTPENNNKGWNYVGSNFNNPFAFGGSTPAKSSNPFL